jgi:hypothetical protein
MARSAFLAGTSAEDAAGCLATGDVWTALTVSRRTLGLALDCALAAERSLYSSEKFLFRRLGRSGLLARHAEQYWRLLHEDFTVSPDGAGAHELTCRRLIVANGLIAHCLLSAWEQPATFFPDPGIRRESFIRSPFFGLTRYSDGVALAAPNSGYEVTEPLALIWSVLDGSGLADAGRRYHAASGPPADESELAEAIDMMIGERSAFGSFEDVLKSSAEN